MLGTNSLLVDGLKLNIESRFTSTASPVTLANKTSKKSLVVVSEVTFILLAVVAVSALEDEIALEDVVFKRLFIGTKLKLEEYVKSSELVSVSLTNITGNESVRYVVCFTEEDKATDAVLAKVALLILPEKKDAVRAYEADIALLMLPEKKDAVRAYEAVTTYEAVSAYEADIALLILPEKYEAVRAKDAVFAFRATNAILDVVVIPIRLIICYKYQSLYSW
jgi:hypothetical protein